MRRQQVPFARDPAHLDVIEAFVLEEALQRLEYGLGVLVGHQADVQLGPRLPGQNRFRAGAVVARLDAQDVGRGAERRSFVDLGSLHAV